MCARYVLLFALETRLKMKRSEESGYTRYEDTLMESPAQIDINCTHHCVIGMKPLSFIRSKFRQMLQ
jgi:hypothetical protein